MISLPRSPLQHRRARWRRSPAAACRRGSASPVSPGAMISSQSIDVAQLADVARPAHRPAAPPCASSPTCARRQPAGLGGALHEMAGQQRDVLAPLAQRRHPRSARRSGGSTDPRGTGPSAISPCRSRLVEAITRTSTSTRVAPPTRSKVCSCSTRTILPWVSSGMSATSSSSSVPPCACSKMPTLRGGVGAVGRRPRRRTAPPPAGRDASSRSSARRTARRRAASSACSMRATTSLPTPAGR